MLRLRLTVDETWLSHVRGLSERAQRNIRRKVRTELVPELQSDVERLLAEPPGPVSSPFAFGSQASRGYWFHLIDTNPELTSGGGQAYVRGMHWIRTGLIESSFVVTSSDRLRGSLITVSNNLSESTGTKRYPARFVYGPFAPPGHVATGWPALLRAAREVLHAKMLNRAYELWFEAMKEAQRG